MFFKNKFNKETTKKKAKIKEATKNKTKNNKRKSRNLKKKDVKKIKKIKKKIVLIKFDISISSKKKNLISILLILKANRMIAILINSYVNIRKNLLRMQSLIKISIIIKFFKKKMKNAKKSWNAIKNFANASISTLIYYYSSLTFINLTKIKDSNFIIFANWLSHVTIY